jgi:hypothetical protein
MFLNEGRLAAPEPVNVEASVTGTGLRLDNITGGIRA